MIERLTLTNIGPFKSKSISFSKITLIKGADATGKSTIVSALSSCLAGTGGSKPARKLLKLGEQHGNIMLSMKIKGSDALVSKTLTRLQDTVNSTNQGLTHSTICKMLNVPTTAMDILMDAWNKLETTTDIKTYVEKALNPSSKDDIMKAIAAELPSEKRERLTKELEYLAPRSTGNVLTYIEKKLATAKTDSTELRETFERDIREATQMLDRSKDLNLDKVKKAKEAIEINNRITMHNEQIAELRKKLIDLEKQEKQKSDVLAPMTMVQTKELEEGIFTLKTQIRGWKEEMDKIPDVPKIDSKLPCKWFTNCKMEESDVLECFEQMKSTNASIKSTLKLKIDTAETSLAANEARMNEIRIQNSATETARNDLQDIRTRISSLNTSIKQHEEIISNIKVIDNVEHVGATLFTMAEEVATWQTKISIGNEKLKQIEQKMLDINDMISATEKAKDKLNTDSTARFLSEITDNIKSIFDKDVALTDELMVGGIPYDMLSMSERLRISLALQYAVAKAINIPIILIDNMNIITVPENIIGLINRIIADKIQLIMLSSTPQIPDMIMSLKEHNPTVITLDKIQPTDEVKAQDGNDWEET